jgi:surfeit locus 1 family protein
MRADVRQAINARNAGLTLLAAALVVAMAWLGRWQYSAYDEHQNADATAMLRLAPIPLDDALGPDAPFPSESVSRPVVVSGRYLPDEQFYVRGMGGSDVYAVATPLLTTSGAAVIVVRGSASAVPVTAPPGGEVRVIGVLEPSQGTAAPLDRTRTTDGIQIPRLVGDISQDLYSGYVIATSTVPADALSPVDVPAPDASFWAGIRNLLYALQWWAFAAFVVFMWWRIVSEPAATADDGCGGPVDHLTTARGPDGGGA